jgi:hypothetical protein
MRTWQAVLPSDHGLGVISISLTGSHRETYRGQTGSHATRSIRNRHDTCIEPFERHPLWTLKAVQYAFNKRAVEPTHVVVVLAVEQIVLYLCYYSYL